MNNTHTRKRLKRNPNKKKTPKYQEQNQPTANQVTLTTTSKPFSSPPGYLNVHIPSRLTSQNAPAAECSPRLPAFPVSPSAAEDLSTRPCCTMVLFTVKR